MDGTITLVLLVLGIFGLVFLVGVFRFSLMKMALRNVWRRKVNVAIVVAGLLVGTAIVTSSFVVGDTFGYIFENDIYNRLDAVDEFIIKPGGQSGSYAYFSEDYYQNLTAASTAGNLPSIDALAPTVMESVPVMDAQTRLSQPNANLMGIDPQADSDLGLFRVVDGDSVSGETLLAQPNSTMINARLAEELEAEVGHYLTIHYLVNGIPQNRTLVVTAIVKNSGKANLNLGDNLFVSMDLAQDMFWRPGMINLIRVSNVGGVDGGMDRSESAKSEIEGVIGTEDTNPDGLTVQLVKKENVQAARDNSEALSELFAIMSTFGIIAGMVLIANIFVMLAEERKPEMGMARALAMKRRHLVLMYLLEGSVYALLAAFLGTFVGLGIAYVMILAFGSIFGVAGFAIPFHFEMDSILLGFAIGALITFFTVLLSSWIISKLNIVRAIRSIPEPAFTKPTRRLMILGGFFVAFGALVTYMGVDQLSAAYFMSGPCMMFIGSALIASLPLGLRGPFTAAGIASIVWILNPIAIVKGLTGGMEMFVLSGVLLVVAALLIIMANSHTIVDLLSRLLSRRKEAIPIIRIALSYPMKKKFRTAMTLFMFALIIFTVAVVAMISSFSTNAVESAYEEQSGGYEIIGFSTTAIVNATDTIQSSPTLAGGFAEIGTMSWSFALVSKEPGGEAISLSFFGADETFLDENDFTFASIHSDYADSTEVWQAVRTNSSLIVVDGSVAADYMYGAAVISPLRVDVGDMIYVSGSPTPKLIVGILDESFFFNGAVMSQEFAEAEFGAQYPTLFFFKGVSDDIEDTRYLAKELEKEFVNSGLQTIVISDLIDEFVKIQASIMNLIQVYLGIGLVVGIAGLGIVAIRSVVERRQEIGVMRAIGFKKRMVGRSFLTETAFISLTGIFAGIFLGVSLSFHIYRDFFGMKASFVDFLGMIPVWNLVIIAVIAFVLTILLTVSSSIRAAKVVPAEALRLKE